MRAFVAVTDNDWFRFLSRLPALDEVNFWQPGEGQQFKALQRGELLLFKLHHPENFIAGGGFFSHSSIGVPCSLVWQWFEERNGVADLAGLRRRIERYRHIPQGHPQTRYADYKIGCVILTQPFFFPREQWIPAPDDFHRSIVRGKGYDLQSGAGRRIWDAVLERLQEQRFPIETEKGKSVFGEPALVKTRLGQGAFRSLITDTYQRRCAITQEKVLPVLEAAHLKPVTEGGLHQVDNGILLRRDFHTLFDQGYVTITPKYQILVSNKLKEEFHNGRHYYQFNGAKIWLPPGISERPNHQFLEWHTDTLFKR